MNKKTDHSKWSIIDHFWNRKSDILKLSKR